MGRVRIPTPLRNLSGGKDMLDTEAGNLKACIEDLESQYPGFRERLCDDTGELRRFVNIYVNGEDVRFLEGLSTPLKESDEISIVPAVAGG
jgi:molybdopterin synthase sulfur carrier subunit